MKASKRNDIIKSDSRGHLYRVSPHHDPGIMLSNSQAFTHLASIMSPKDGRLAQEFEDGPEAECLGERE